MKAWQAQEAKMRFGDLIRSAKISPQLITVRGNAEIVVMSTNQYKKLNKAESSILDVMQKFPHKKMKLDIKRSQDSNTRKTDL